MLLSLNPGVSVFLMAAFSTPSHNDDLLRPFEHARREADKDTDSFSCLADAANTAPL